MKTFKQWNEEAPATNTTSVPGAGEDNTLHTRPKRRYRVVTRHYVEIQGKRKKQVK